ncbi:putative mitochondrial protein [Sesamum angolense]|uniref:Mitochondrial protein n=1 Tax=Sesamum angolense TaxID=2727404 RepID=A0AAE2BR09_9LAMI|nr:putative mitochondrial protein [Sesamum angolense]
MWEKLLELRRPLSMPWLILGDFNCVKSSAEKQLGAPPTWYELKDFADCFLVLGLHDAQTTGCYYTWYSNSDSNPVWCKLDRVILNNDWLEVGLHCRAHFNPPGCLSDHSPVRAKEADLALQNAQIYLESNPEDTAVRDSLGDLRKKVTFLAEAERHFYYQKAKIHFLKQGNKNTKFFYDMVKRNATRNSILAIVKGDGSIITSTPDIAQEFIDFYTSLLGTEDQILPFDDEIFHWGPSLTLEFASDLCRAVTPTEVNAAVFQISDNKAPDPDGYTSCFFKKLNHTIIALVPKSGHSPSVADYRSISRCNVIYIVITKIIANRLSPALEHLIDSSQAAFVEGRNITDNIFLAQEMVRQYSRKRILPHCTINVDLRKTFNSVSWTFLSRVLHGYGFPPLFISWIMECVSTTSFSVALNGSIHGLFLGKKGLRQGDPMSPALFLLCMEYFSRLIKRNTSNSDFNFHPKCEKLKITHLLFADDLMLFSRGDLPSIHILMECLKEFRDVSGLAVNTSKSSIFTAGIQDDILDGILATTELLGATCQSGISADWNLYAPLSRVWSAFGSKSSLSQQQLLKRSTVCAGPSFGTPREHRWPERKFAIRRRKVVWVSGISNPGTLLSLPEFYGTFIARQTPYGLSGSMRFTSGGPRFGTGSRRRAILHSFDDLLRSGTGLSLISDLQTQQSSIWHSYCLNTHSFCGLDYGRGWQHETDLPSYRRTHRAHCALTVRNRPNIYSLNAPSVPMFGRISDSGLASPDVCQPFSVQSSGLRKGRSAPPCRTNRGISLWHARFIAFGDTVMKLSLKTKLQIPTGL